MRRLSTDEGDGKGFSSFPEQGRSRLETGKARGRRGAGAASIATAQRR